MSKKFKVDFEYSVPEFTEITLTAKDADEAEDLANIEFMKLYPEALDAEVVLITELDTVV